MSQFSNDSNGPTVQQLNLKSLLLLGKLPKIHSQGSLLPSSASSASAMIGTPDASIVASAAASPASPAPQPAQAAAVNPLPQPLPPAFAPVLGPSLGPSLGSNTPFSSLIPALMTLKGQMMQDLEDHVQRLLNLNPSRREAIAAYLDRLASQSSAPSAAEGLGDAAGGLRRWIEGPKSPAQSSALRAYFEEVALIYLSQAILLKAWSDAGVRRWTEADVGKLNWSLSTSLKPHIPLDREGWQVTKPNLYSWYTPNSAIQHQVWLTLEQTQMSEEGPALLFSISGPARQARPEATIPHGYDLRFFKALWNSTLKANGDLTSERGPIKRNRMAFSPTLRDGTMVRTGPSTLNWAGMEACPFQLMIAELMQLWWGPQTPPLWAIGTGLEAHTRDQLSLGLNSPKPSLLSRIAEMEACDVSFVLEERMIRAPGRNAEANRLREQLDSLPYFKKLKSAGTSLGDLQTCVALSKLRPGGLLWWAREEPLSTQDGSEVLSFILDRSRILGEWDFSPLEHALPVSLPLFPKYLYLLSRESRVEERLNHHPLRITVSGQIRSHIELPMMLEDALGAHLGQSGVDTKPQSRGQWHIHLQRSPTCQKDWSERWPDPACQNTLKELEKLRTLSEPLAHACTIRSIPPKFQKNTAVEGVWVQTQTTDQRRELVARRLSDVPCEEGSGLGFAILVPGESWVEPLITYLRSAAVRNWLEHHAERKGENWILTEQVVRWIPVPRALLKVLQQGNLLAMNPEWAKVVQDASVDSKTAKQLVSLVSSQLGNNDEGTQELKAAIFVKTVQALEEFRKTKQRLLSIVDPHGRIQWRELLQVLPQSELISLSMHPKVQVTGTLPPHLPVNKIEKVKTPSPGVLLATELGFFIHLACDGSTVLDMLWEQICEAQHPTWSELLQSVKLPRRVEFAQSTAHEILRSHAESSAHRDALIELLSACSIY